MRIHLPFALVLAAGGAVLAGLAVRAFRDGGTTDGTPGVGMEAGPDAGLWRRDAGSTPDQPPASTPSLRTSLPRAESRGLQTHAQPPNVRAGAPPLHSGQATPAPDLGPWTRDPRVAVLLDPSADDTDRNEAAVALRQARYPGIAGDLIRVLENPDEKERFRAFAMQHLGGIVNEGRPAAAARTAAPSTPSPGGDGAPPLDRIAASPQITNDKFRAVLRAGLDDRHTAVRREALLALVRLRDPVAADEVRRILYGDDARDDDRGRTDRGRADRGRADRGQETAPTAMMDLAIRCARELDLRECLLRIRECAGDANEVIRIAAIVALADWGDADSRPAFETAAASDSFRLQRAGKRALARIGR